MKTILRLPDYANEVEEEADVEVYLLFCNNVLNLFEEVTKKLEKNYTTTIDLYATIRSFRDKLQQRKRDFLMHQKME